jgi:hypothetical protein
MPDMSVSCLPGQAAADLISSHEDFAWLEFCSPAHGYISLLASSLIAQTGAAPTKKGDRRYPIIYPERSRPQWP